MRWKTEVPENPHGLLPVHAKPSTNIHTRSIGPHRNFRGADSKNTHKKGKRILKREPWDPIYDTHITGPARAALRLWDVYDCVSAPWLPASAECSNFHDRTHSILKWSHLAWQSSRTADRLLWYQTIHWSRHASISSSVSFILLQSFIALHKPLWNPVIDMDLHMNYKAPKLND